MLLASSAVPTFAALRLRDHYDWEETDALVALGVTCGAAALVAAALVMPLLVVYSIVRMWLTTDYS